MSPTPTVWLRSARLADGRPRVRVRSILEEVEIGGPTPKPWSDRMLPRRPDALPRAVFGTSAAGARRVSTKGV